MSELSRRERERQHRKSEIVDAAERVFSHKGFEASSMDMISQEAQFTKRTVYQYFTSKEDLYLAVVTKGVSNMFAYIKERASRGKTARQRLRLLGEAYYGFSREYPSTYRLINERQVMALVKNSAPSKPHANEIGHLRHVLLRDLSATIAQGREDGTIRSDIDPGRTAVSWFLLLTGFFYRLLEVADTYTEASGVPEDSLVAVTLDLLDDAIRPRDSVTRPSSEGSPKSP